MSNQRKYTVAFQGYDQRRLQTFANLSLARKFANQWAFEGRDVILTNAKGVILPL